ncbi:MAG: YHS domain-containing (seleno)protein, partial [Pseudomonadota bacterium]
MLPKTKSLAIAASLSAALLGGFITNSVAASEINVAPGKTLAGPGLAVHGFDPVAYFAEGKPAQGSAEFSVVHGDATYRFASASNMKAFRANPDKYVPAFGGYCAYGVAVGAKFDGDPRYWKIV